MNSRIKQPNRPWALVFTAMLMMLAFVLPSLAFAQGGGGGGAGGSTFAFAPDDYFINVILKGILGDIINVGASNAQTTVTGSGTLGEVFRTMNLGIAFFGSMIVIFITVVGILQSGNDGEFLGRKWSSMWVPVRFATGSALMLPLTASGYSYCQALVIWIAAQGIGFADTLWSSIVSNVVVKNGAQISATYDTKKLLTNMAVFEACVAAANKTNTEAANGVQAFGRSGPVVTGVKGVDGRIIKHVAYYWGNTGSTQTGQDSMNQRSACGSMSYSYPDASAAFGGSSGDDPYMSIRLAVDSYNRTAIEKYSDIYKTEIQAVVDETLKEDGTSNPAPLIKAFMDRLPDDIADFNKGLATDGTAAFAASGYTTTTQANMTKYGFAVAGMWYMDVLRAHNTLRQSFAVPETTDPKPEVLIGSSVTRVSDSLTILHSQMKSDKQGGAGSGSSQVNEGGTGGTADAPVTTAVTSLDVGSEDFSDLSSFNSLSARFANYMRGVFFGVGATASGPTPYSSWTFQGNSQLNPNVSAIMQLKNKGDAILDIAGVLVAADITAKIINAGSKMSGPAAAVGNTIADFSVMGFLAKAAAAVGVELSTYILGAAMAMFLLGMTLSVLIPMMPYILWVGAILGLVILILEALVAIMLWAVMMMHPSGEGLTSQYNEKGLHMLLAVFMRPSLLLMGYVVGMFMLEPMITFINDTFSVMVSSVQANSFTGLFTFIAFIGIYVSLVLMTVEKSFAMIHVLADRVLTWIGGIGSLTGEEAEAKGRGDQMLRAGSSAMNTALLSRRMKTVPK